MTAAKSSVSENKRNKVQQRRIRFIRIQTRWRYLPQLPFLLISGRSLPCSWLFLNKLAQALIIDLSYILEETLL